MYEVDVIVTGDSFKQWILPLGNKLVPAHVRHRPARSGLQSAYRVRQNSETIGWAFLRVAEQELHPEADAEDGLRERRQNLRNRSLPQPLHRVFRGADPRKHHAARGGDRLRIRRDMSARTESFERESERCEVGAAAVDDDRIH